MPSLDVHLSHFLATPIKLSLCKSTEIWLCSLNMCFRIPFLGQKSKLMAEEYYFYISHMAFFIMDSLVSMTDDGRKWMIMLICSHISV